MPYPRRLGQSVDCTDLTTWASDPSCVGTDPMTGQQIVQPTDPNFDALPIVTPSSSSGSPVTGIVSTFLTDLTNFFRPGTPTTVPTYTPSPTNPLGSAVNNPWLWVIGGVAVYAWAKGRR